MSSTPSQLPPAKSAKELSDLALISKMIQSISPKSSAPPPIPPKISSEAVRRLEAASAEKRAKEKKSPPPPAKLPLSPLKPKRDSPASPQASVSHSEMDDEVLRQPNRAAPLSPQMSALGINPPSQALFNSTPDKLLRTQTALSPSPPKKVILTRERAANILRRARESIVLGGIISPETDSDASDDEGEYVMSGGLQNNDLSERELNGKPPRKHRVSKFSEDFSMPGLLDGPTTFRAIAAEESMCAKQRSENETAEDKKDRVKQPPQNSPEKVKKEAVRLTRTHKRRSTGATIGNAGYVVDSESETEYYESFGPVGGCAMS